MLSDNIGITNVELVLPATVKLISRTVIVQLPLIGERHHINILHLEGISIEYLICIIKSVLISMKHILSVYL